MKWVEQAKEWDESKETDFVFHFYPLPRYDSGLKKRAGLETGALFSAEWGPRCITVSALLKAAAKQLISVALILENRCWMPYASTLLFSCGAGQLGDGLQLQVHPLHVLHAQVRGCISPTTSLPHNSVARVDSKSATVEMYSRHCEVERRRLINSFMRLACLFVFSQEDGSRHVRYRIEACLTFLHSWWTSSLMEVVIDILRTAHSLLC